MLLDGGADIEAKENNGGTPVMLASSEGHDKVVKLLLDGGADIEVKDKE